MTMPAGPRNGPDSAARPLWPDGKRFAFSIFDDPDSQTRDAGVAVYEFLADLGLRTTKGVWPNAPHRQPSDHGETCGNSSYVDWVLSLQARGFEVGYHNATSHTSDREHTASALDTFARLFGHYPVTMSNHYYCHEGIYFTEDRLTGAHRLAYRALTLCRRRNMSFGHREGHPLFWGDLCRRHVRYVRNFTYADVNTLSVCPFMPYHDPARPYVNFWFASTEAPNLRVFLQRVTDAALDRLEERGGACILYVHFGHGYAPGGQLDETFRRRMERLSRKAGWFVPVGQLLDHLRSRNGAHHIEARQRARLEQRWLLQKLRGGTA